MTNEGTMTLPQTPSGQELEMKQREDMLHDYWLDASKDYPEPLYLLEYKGVGFSPLGGIQAISGQKKHGKTFVLAQLMSAILGADKEKVRAYLHGLTTRESTLKTLDGSPTVLYVDTEMEKLNSAKVLRRVHWFCDWDTKANDPRFRVLWLRSVEEVRNDKDEVVKSANMRRRELVFEAIEQMKPTAVFIDGIRDLIDDFNDNAMSSTLVSELMRLAEKHHCCIWSVLHGNPRMQVSDVDDNKMRGHLGTELGNKVSDTFISIKKKDANGVTFTVKQQDARGKDVEDWSFQVVEDAGALGVPRIIDNAQQTRNIDDIFKEKETENDTKIREAIMAVCPPPLTQSFTELREALKKELNIGSKKAKAMFDRAIELGIIEKRINGKYSVVRNDEPKQTTIDDEPPF